MDIAWGSFCVCDDVCSVQGLRRGTIIFRQHLLIWVVMMLVIMVCDEELSKYDSNSGDGN